MYSKIILFILLIICFIVTIITCVHNNDNSNVLYCNNTSEHVEMMIKVFKKRDIKNNNYKYVLCYDDNYDNYAYLGNNIIFVKLKNKKIISNKKELWKTLSSYYGINKAKDITPMTYLLPEEHTEYQKECNNIMMILKQNVHRQEGLFVTKQIQPLWFINKEKFIVAQRFMANTLKYNNHKVTFRLYLIIECHNGKMKAYYYDDGLVYYSFVKNGNIASFYDSEYLYDKGYPITINDYISRTKRNIKTDMILKLKYLVDAIKYKICNMDCNTDNNNKYYELFGVDFHLTSDLKAYILEVNSGTGMSPHDDRDNLLRQSLIKSYVKLISGEATNLIPL